MLSNVAQPAGKGSPYTDQVSQCLEGALVQLGQRESVASASFPELLLSAFACLEKTDDFFGRLLNGFIEGGKPGIDGRDGPSLRDVVLEGGDWWLKEARQHWGQKIHG